VETLPISMISADSRTISLPTEPPKADDLLEAKSLLVSILRALRGALHR
jgi:hypothetical protein